MTAQALAQLRMIEKELARVNGGMAASGAGAATFASGVGRAGVGMGKFGNQLQWTGRQLQNNFTLPLAIAGGAAVKFALDNEQGMTRVAKVYGDATIKSSVLKNELGLLQKVFVQLSNHYGVQQKEVLNIASAWASAGASGTALAKGVETTLRTMVLGELNSVDATKSLISIQAVYGLSSAGLVSTMNMLNTIENETTVSTADMVTGFVKAGSVAKDAGIDTQHLAAMVASLVPAAGSAAEAGNGLKTIISRMLAPTRDAAKYLNAMGLNIDTVNWQSKNGTDRLEAFAQSFHSLADSQKAEVAAALGSRFQINKLGILLEDIDKKFDKTKASSSRYAKALRVSGDEEQNLKTATKELNTVLNSSPQRLKIIWATLQNGMANAVQPLIPYLLYAATAVQKMFQAFGNLPGPIKKFVVVALLSLTLFGPLLKYIGSTIALLSQLRWFFFGAAKAALGAAGAMLKFMLLPFTFVSKGLALLWSGALKVFGPGVAAAWSAYMTVLRSLAMASGAD